MDGKRRTNGHEEQSAEVINLYSEGSGADSIDGDEQHYRQEYQNTDDEEEEEEEVLVRKRHNGISSQHQIHSVPPPPYFFQDSADGQQAGGSTSQQQRRSMNASGNQNIRQQTEESEGDRGTERNEGKTPIPRRRRFGVGRDDVDDGFNDSDFDFGSESSAGSESDTGLEFELESDTDAESEGEPILSTSKGGEADSDTDASVGETEWYNNIPKDFSIQKNHFEECSPHRSVDYNHRYDWMHPMAPLRMENERKQAEIVACYRTITQLLFANQVSNKCCLNCINDHILKNKEGEPVRHDFNCPKCYCRKLLLGRLEDEHQAVVHEARERLRTLLEGFTPEQPEELQSRCHWCGIQIPSDSRTIEEFLAWARVDIKGVGPLPCLYPFDHEQRRLCLHCVAECGALLKEKRRFQSLYELTAKALPSGCNNCGIRESFEFRPSIDRTGELCFCCSDFQEREGLVPDPPALWKRRFQELRGAILDNTDITGIHWDRIANNPKVNQEFVFSAHGLLNQWMHHLKKPEAPALTCYILLQRDHRTRRSQDWELYTCHARNPTQAALYFARFVALYKKQPMTYLYIRQLEEWNIPDPRGDEWEDLSSGLLTFEQLKNRIRKTTLHTIANEEAMTEGEGKLASSSDRQRKKQITAYEAAKKTLKDSVKSALMRIRYQSTLQPRTLERWPVDEKEKRVWKAYMKLFLNKENKHLAKQLHWDKEESQRYFKEYRRVKDFFLTNKLGQHFSSNYRAMKRNTVVQELLRRDRDWDYEGVLKSLNRRRMKNFLPWIAERFEREKKLVQGILEWVSLDPPEFRTRHLPPWAQENARAVVRDTVRDNWLLHLHQRHLQYMKIKELKASSDQNAAAERARSLSWRDRKKIKSMAKDISKVAEAKGHAPRTWQDCVPLAREIFLREHGYDVSSERSKDLDKLMSGYYVRLRPDHTLTPLPRQIRMLRPNTLRIIAGERPELSDVENKEREAFLLEDAEIDRTLLRQSKPVAALSIHHFHTTSEFHDRPLFPKRAELPRMHDPTPTPSAEYPLHLLPVEYQVHVFQSVLIPETRTANVRLVRTERYKRQADSIQGGGLVDIPKVINRENTRGFYRDNARKRRRDRRDDGVDRELLVVLKGTKKRQQSGIENWEPVDMKSLVEGKFLQDERLEKRLRSSYPPDDLQGEARKKWQRMNRESPKVRLGTRELTAIQKNLGKVVHMEPDELQLFQRRLYRMNPEPYINEPPILEEVEAMKAGREKARARGLRDGSIRDTTRPPSLSPLSEARGTIVSEHGVEDLREEDEGEDEVWLDDYFELEGENGEGEE
ncbi:hypothetical protein EDD21DRAFT_74486 [Dissophora ornata]|nr:hypothetical protein EDD21DRAFT_74486 [Dissophora ornata]